MSHVVSIDIEIKDLDSLKKAVEDLGLQFNEGQQTFKWYGRWMDDYHGQDAAYRTMDPGNFGKCDHAISIPGNSSAYEIGVVDNDDGTFRLVWDNWQGGKGLTKIVGPGAQNLVQSYAKEKTKKYMKSNGYTVKEKKTQDGTVQLVCEAY